MTRFWLWILRRLHVDESTRRALLQASADIANAEMVAESERARNEAHRRIQDEADVAHQAIVDKLEAERDSLKATLNVEREERMKLEAEKTILEATVKIREAEVKELSLHVERSRKRLEADLAAETAREVKATHISARPTGERHD